MVTGSLPISMRIIRSERIIYIKYKQEVFSMIYQETYTLANGNKIPKVALGTWPVSYTHLTLPTN